MKAIWKRFGWDLRDQFLEDRGFLFGIRVMTTMKVLYPTSVIDFDRHYDRLRSHAVMQGLSFSEQQFGPAKVLFEIEAMMQNLSMMVKNSGSDKGHSYICRLFLTPGQGALKSKLDQSELWIQLEVDESHPVKSLSLEAVSLGHWKRGEQPKTGLYDHVLKQYWMSKHQGFDDTVFCNSDQEFAELTTANIFFIGRDGDLVEIATPPPSSGIVIGVTRNRVIDLLTMAKIPVTERIITLDELARFDEAFATSSIAGVVPINRINRHRLQTDRENSVFKHVYRLWNTWTSIQIQSSPSEHSQSKANLI